MSGVWLYSLVSFGKHGVARAALYGCWNGQGLGWPPRRGPELPLRCRWGRSVTRAPKISRRPAKFLSRIFFLAKFCINKLIGLYYLYTHTEWLVPYKLTKINHYHNNCYLIGSIVVTVYANGNYLVWSIHVSSVIK